MKYNYQYSILTVTPIPAVYEMMSTSVENLFGRLSSTLYTQVRTEGRGLLTWNQSRDRNCPVKMNLEKKQRKGETNNR